MKSQASVEFLILLAISLLVILVVIQMSQDSLTTYDKMVTRSKIDSMLNEVSTASELVYQQGYGAKTTVYVTIPADIRNISLDGNIISVEYLGGDKQYRNFDFDVVGNIPPDEGNYWLEVEAMTGFVVISMNASNITQIFSVCGNNIKETGEECDGDDLDGRNCAHFGYPFGILQCVDCSYDTTLCSLVAAEVCYDGEDNDADGMIDCKDDDCIGFPGPQGGLCCNGDDQNCAGILACKHCGANDECVFADTSTVCDASYYCSDGGNNGYRSDGRTPSQGYCDGFGNCDFALSTPLCNYAPFGTTEAAGQTICLDGQSACTDTCSDGIDNDMDGCIDSINDSNCGVVESACNDSVDNNCNGLTDCADPGCKGYVDCGIENCTNLIDDDGDGYADCMDTACIGEIGPYGSTCCAGNSSFCTGIDSCKDCDMNDECYYYGSLTPCDTTYLCSTPGDDGYNSGGNVPSQAYCDGSGNCDFAHNAPICTLEEGNTSEFTGATLCVDGISYCIDVCNDGISNDGDDCIDDSDSGCGAEETLCLNLVDDDCDTYGDCYDPWCIANEPMCEPEETNCTDGIDNDNDGGIDCDDSQCIGQVGPRGGTCCDGNEDNCLGQASCKECDAYDECYYYSTSTVCNINYVCSNAGDNGYNSGGRVPSVGYCDGNGNCDYASSTPLCSLAEGTASEGSSLTVCEDSETSCIATCSDSTDNDADGCTDSVDSGCGGSETNCYDGFDNDCDNMVDCSDIDCAYDMVCQSCDDRLTCAVCLIDSRCDWCERSAGVGGSHCVEGKTCKTGAVGNCAFGVCYGSTCP